MQSLVIALSPKENHVKHHVAVTWYKMRFRFTSQAWHVNYLMLHTNKYTTKRVSCSTWCDLKLKTFLPFRISASAFCNRCLKLCSACFHDYKWILVFHYSGLLQVLSSDHSEWKLTIVAFGDLFLLCNIKSRCPRRYSLTLTGHRICIDTSGRGSWDWWGTCTKDMKLPVCCTIHQPWQCSELNSLSYLERYPGVDSYLVIWVLRVCHLPLWRQMQRRFLLRQHACLQEWQWVPLTPGMSADMHLPTKYCLCQSAQ